MCPFCAGDRILLWHGQRVQCSVWHSTHLTACLLTGSVLAFAHSCFAGLVRPDSTRHSALAHRLCMDRKGAVYLNTDISQLWSLKRRGISTKWGDGRGQGFAATTDGDNTHALLFGHA